MKSKRGGGGGGGPSSEGGGGGGNRGGGGGGHGPKGGGEGEGDVDDGAERGAPEASPPLEEPPLIGGDGIVDPSLPDRRGGFPVPSPVPRPSPQTPTPTPAAEDPAPLRRPSPEPSVAASPTPGVTPAPSPATTASPSAAPSHSPVPPGTVVKLSGVVPDPTRYPALRFLPVERHRQYGAGGEPTAGSALLVDIESHVKFPRHDAALGVRAAADVLRIGDQMRGPAFDAERFFYLGEGKGVRLANPHARFADIRQYVPPGMQALPQFQTFLSDKPERTQVLEVFDSWNAATLGVAAGVEMSRANPSAPPSIHLGDLLPLTIYATSTLQAVRHADPNFFRDNAALKETYKMFAERAMMVLAASAEQPAYREEMLRAVRLMHDFTTAPECLPARQLLVETYGAEWARRVFGIDESQNNRR